MSDISADVFGRCKGGTLKIERGSESRIISPYRGKLINLLAPPEAQEQLREHARRLPRVQLSERSLCDLEVLSTGGFSPVDRFFGRDDYLSVIETMRMKDNTLFPIPLTLPVKKETSLVLDKEIALVDPYQNVLAVMTLDEIYEWDLKREAQLAYGTNDLRHPLVAEMHSWGELNISGRLSVITLPAHYDFRNLRLTPTAIRKRLADIGLKNVVAFQTRNPLHRAHEEMIHRATESVNGALLFHPVIGMTKPGDVDHYTRVRCYRILAERYFDSKRTLLALLPLAMRMAGPREALWHAIIRRNCGANHLIVGRDHASPGKDSAGRSFYGPYEAQELFSRHADEIGVQLVPFSEFVYLPDDNRYEEAALVSQPQRTTSISGTEVREEYLRKGRRLPEWFTRPEVAAILATTYPPAHQRGFCVWFTGLSGSGKSTTANIVTTRLLEHGRQVTLLDGDVVRTNLSQGLGFDKRDRDINIHRIGFVAAEIVRHGGAVVCAAVSPYRAARNECRALIGDDHFFEIFVDTPLEICEARDAKGMYALARTGAIKHFTGIDDPYEPPLDPEIVIETTRSSAQDNAETIVAYLIDAGMFLGEDPIGD